MRPMLLNGEWVERENFLPVIDPESGVEIDRVPMAAVEDVDSAVEGCVKACVDPLPAHERARILEETSRRLEDSSEEAARLIASEGIKTINEARGEAARAAMTMRLCAAEARQIAGRTLNFDQAPAGVDRFGLTVREPLGIIGAITPFNDPLNLVAHKVGPALASGNATILKPDSNTPLSALFLAELLVDAGLPAGWLQVLTGRGSTVGNAIVIHPRVKMVSFTGGVDAGRTIMSRVGLKRVQMELGANNPVIVCADADLDLALDRISSGAFWAAGQNCLHVQRVYAHEDVFDDVVAGLAKRATSIVLGAKLDEETEMGPMIDSLALARMGEIVDEAVTGGAEVVCGGEAHGAAFRPTLLVDVPPGARAYREETYGPITVLAPYRDLDDALTAANSTEYGLQSAVFTRDITTAFRAATRLRSGGVMVNESTDFRIDAMPFGGFGASGLGREGVSYAVTAMTDPKVIAFTGVDVPGLG